ncbi:MAG TPA: chorismate pyruvate-lyase family protein [Acidimicrobiales bacterium]|nr:chorismate pyruvate-lyase family protein [Acidimicrobiales bacterium]
MGRSSRVIGPEVAGLERAVLDTPDTVTRFLEALTGEVVVADVVRRYPVVLGADNQFGAAAGEDATGRIAVLRGSASNLAYLYAESVFLAARLPETVRLQLEGTGEPIGRILADHGLQPVRATLTHGEEVGAGPPDPAALLDSEVVWSRAYRLLIEGSPVFVIREWFLHPVLEALGRQDQE